MYIDVLLYIYIFLHTPIPLSYPFPPFLNHSHFFYILWQKVIYVIYETPMVLSFLRINITIWNLTPCFCFHTDNVTGIGLLLFRVSNEKVCVHPTRLVNWHLVEFEMIQFLFYLLCNYRGQSCTDSLRVWCAIIILSRVSFVHGHILIELNCQPHRSKMRFSLL